MTITDIQPARKGMSRLYIDGEFALSLDTRALSEYGVSAGMEIDDDELHELIEKCEYRRAKEKALWLLSGKDYSRKGLFDKLIKEASEDTAEEICSRMEELGLIDDEKYARRLAHDLFYIKKLSYRGVVYKLMEKGIDKELCEEIADEFEIDPVEQLIEKKKKKYSDKLDDEKNRRRTIAALQRLGYNWGDIKSALAEFE